MSLLDNSVIELGVESTSDKLRGGAWVDFVADRGQKQVVPRLPAGLQGAAGKSVDRIVQSRGALGTVTSRGFLKITSYIGAGMEDEAKLIFLREHATHAQRQSALKAAINAAYDANAEADAAWKEIKSASLDILKMMGQAAIPMLLMML